MSGRPAGGVFREDLTASRSPACPPLVHPESPSRFGLNLVWLRQEEGSFGPGWLAAELSSTRWRSGPPFPGPIFRHLCRPRTVCSSDLQHRWPLSVDPPKILNAVVRKVAKAFVQTHARTDSTSTGSANTATLG